MHFKNPNKVAFGGGHMQVWKDISVLVTHIGFELLWHVSVADVAYLFYRLAYAFLLCPHRPILLQTVWKNDCCMMWEGQQGT